MFTLGLRNLYYVCMIIYFLPSYLLQFALFFVFIVEWRDSTHYSLIRRTCQRCESPPSSRRWQDDSMRRESCVTNQTAWENKSSTRDHMLALFLFHFSCSLLNFELKSWMCWFVFFWQKNHLVIENELFWSNLRFRSRVCYVVGW
jgi:hypothetical protein